MDNQEIQHLVSLGKAGNKTAFSAVIRHFQPKIFTLAFRMLCDEDDAKDVVQDTFLRAWLQLNTYNPDFQFSTWLYKIASNICLDRLNPNSAYFSRSLFKKSDIVACYVIFFAYL